VVGRLESFWKGRESNADSGKSPVFGKDEVTVISGRPWVRL
jgi:hypothetical protein